MAGLCGLRMLLLAAGLMGMANCLGQNDTGQNNDTVPDLPSTSASPSSTSASPSSTSASPSSTSASPPNTSASPSSTSASPPNTSASPSSTSASPSSTSASPSNASASPSSTSASPSSTSASPSSTSASPSNASASPSSTSASPSSTSVSPSSTVATTTTGRTSPPCGYSVKPVRFGVRFTFENVSEGSYTIQLTEQNTDYSIVKTWSLNNTHKADEVLHLKPSTVYSYSVHGNASNATCGQNANVTTNNIDQNDTARQDCNPYICFKTNWNISTAQIFVNLSDVSCKMEKTFCIKPKYTDICSDLTIISGANLTAWIGPEFLNTADIILRRTEPTWLPPQIHWENKPKCQQIHINYTCQERGQTSRRIPLDQLEPYTQYDCTGAIESQSIPINKTITEDVNIKCDLTLNVQSQELRNTSITLRWEPDSNHCPNFTNHLSYSCSCVKEGSSNNKRVVSKDLNCTVGHLDPFTEYKCQIQPYFKNVSIKNLYKHIGITTKPGVPPIPDGLQVTLKGHNRFDVHCLPLSKWNGREGHYIARLTHGTTQSEVKEKHCHFEFKDLSYSTAYNLSVSAHNGDFEGLPRIKAVETLYNDKALIGFLVFLILLTSVALAFVLYRIYILRRKKSHLGEGLMLIPSTNDEDQLMRVEPIGAEVLLEVYKKKIADEGRLFLAEFQSIPRIFSRNNMKEAKRSYNAYKNRYVDILPYDYNRVQLTTGNGETGCDYINASFINGFQESKKYIAAQGPKDETVAGFWRMIWEQKSSIIVMVTRCEEGNRVKCAQYWPSAARETEIYEEFIVKLYKEEQCPDYIIRRFTVSNKREHSEREVTQIQFISWPDHGVPEEPQLLLKLRKRVNAFKNLFSGPIVVHCSAGVGRTGTYIGIDAMMEGLESEGQVDIYGYIVNLRKQRCLMVQVETQYILIHQAIIEHNQFGETEISMSEYHSVLSMLSTGSGEEPDLLQEEFQRLPKYKNWRTCNTGLTEENKKKNRFSSVIPYDYNRVFVKLDEDQTQDGDRDHEEEDGSSEEEEEQDEESMKYINASHVDGYWGPGSLITAQSPLADTIADFWLMVYQKRATVLVMLSDCTEGATELCSPYWDQEKKAFEDIEVEVIETECTPAFTIRTMQIYHTKRKESRRVKQFHFLQWSYQKLPENSLQLTDMIRTIKQTCGYSSGPLEGRGPLVVHCSNGSCQSGVFCALWNLMDSASTERMADVFQVAKSLRKERQGMISSQEQYRFLYEALAAAFPVQNGEAAAAPAAVHVVDETGHSLEEPAGSATDDQQAAVSDSVAGVSTPLVGKPTKPEEEQDEAASKTTAAVEAAGNGSTVTMEV